MNVSAAQERGRKNPEITRQELLDAAFEEIYANGFRATGIDAIVATTGVTKGSLYHHFANKQELGYAVVEERVKPLIRERYLVPFRASQDDPVQALHQMGARMEEELLKVGILKKGCPLNNLVLEMSGIDEGFRVRLAEILREWEDTIAEGLRLGQARSLIRPAVDTDASAKFIVASYQGACGVAKNALDIAPFRACRDNLDAFAETFRPDQVA